MLETLAHVIQSAVICKLCREQRNDLATPQIYLASCFPELPLEMRDAIIISTFKTAQKVAATHTDTLLDGSDKRSVWAKQSLARWLHGLSIPEPAAKFNTQKLDVEPADPGVYSLTNNFLLSKELPVPLDSQAQRLDALRDFDRTTQEIMAAAQQAAGDNVNQVPAEATVVSTLKVVAEKLLEVST